MFAAGSRGGGGMVKRGAQAPGWTRTGGGMPKFIF